MSAEPKPGSPPEGAPPASEPQSGFWRRWPRLGGVVAQGVLWTTGGFGLSQFLRLAANLTLTRLLSPEAFGLMAIVDTVLMGLYMTSDTGVGQTLVQRRNPPHESLLDTVWSIQALRGLLLYGVLLLMAGPLANLYGEPMLLSMLSIAGGRLLLEGFQSTAIYEAMRTMAIRRLVLLEVVVQVGGLLFMLVFAWYWPSVWALLWGGVVASAMRLVASHWLFPRSRPRFRWDPECVRELVRFGRWLLPSTLLLFVIMRSDRLLLAKWFSVADLGAYTIASFIPLTAIAVAGQVSHNVLFPVVARLRDSPSSPLHSEIGRRRVMFLGFSLPLLCTVAVFGDWLVALLYDSRYQEAGWMLRVLSCGAIVACANESSLAALLGLGDAYRRFVALLLSALLFIGSILVGGALGGRLGLVIGVAAAPAFAYPMISWALHKHRAWTAGLDGIAFSSAFALIALLTGLRWLLETSFA